MPVRPTPGPMAAVQECAGLPPPGLPSPCLPLPLPLRIGLARRYPLNETSFFSSFPGSRQAFKDQCAARRAAMSEAKDKKDYYEVVAHVLRSVNVPCQGAMQAGHAAFDCGRCGVRALLLLGAQPAPAPAEPESEAARDRAAACRCWAWARKPQMMKSRRHTASSP